MIASEEMNSIVTRPDAADPAQHQAVVVVRDAGHRGEHQRGIDGDGAEAQHGRILASGRIALA